MSFARSSRFEDLQQEERERLERYYNQQAGAELYVMDNSARPIKSNRVLFADGHYDASLQSLLAAAASEQSPSSYEPLLAASRQWLRAYGILALVLGAWLFASRKRIARIAQKAWTLALVMAVL